MKLSFIFIFFALVQVAATSYSQSINLDVNNMEIRQVIKNIEQQSEYRFFYTDGLTDLSRKVDMKLTEQPIEEALLALFDNTQLGFQLVDNKLIILAPKGILQQITITGTVTDNGEPLPGVNVLIKGTTAGTSTDAEGRYSINVPGENAVLQFTYIGYNTQEVTVGTQKTININLIEDTRLIEEVVVIGYGTMKKINLTGAVSTVNVEKELESRPLTNLSMALSGVVPGLTVMQGSGQPNSDGATLLIRGLGTLNSSSPLVLVDGMEQGFGSVNPMDVVSITVLKDAASCAIYGNRGANGVILITTKKGERAKVNVNYSGNFSFNKPFKLIELINNGAEYMELYNESMSNIGSPNQFMNETINLWREAERNPNGISEFGYPNYVAFPNTDWYREVFNNQLMQEHTVSLVGASESGKINFNFSGSYLDNPGLIEGGGLKKYNVRSNINVDVTDWLQVGNRSYGYQSDVGPADVPAYLNNNNLTNHKNNPLIYPFYDGKYGGTAALEDDAGIHNPLLVINNRGGSLSYSQINTALFANVRLFKDLVYHVDFDWQRYWTEQATHTKGFGKYNFRHDTWSVPPDPLNTLRSTLYVNGAKRWRYLQTLTYNKTFDDLHEVGALFGYEENSYKSYDANSSKTGLLDLTITDLTPTTAMTSITGSNSQFTSRSWFGRVTYGFKSRYLIEANLRYDGSSRFAPENRWGLFPAFSAAWRVMEEQFMEGTPFDNLKLRASWGKLGNNSIGNYEWQATYNPVSIIQGGNESITPGLVQTVLANTNLQWESTRITNLAVETAFLNNRLVAEIDVYDKLTDGILYRPTIFHTLGIKSGPLENIAEVSNKGVEVFLGWYDRIDEFSYGIKGNFTFNKNRVTRYRGKLEQGWTVDESGNRVYSSNIGDVSTGGSTRVIEDKIINEWYLLSTYQGDQTYKNPDGSVNINGGPKDGMIRTEQDMEWLQAMREAGYAFYPNQSIGKANIWYGDYIYADINGDGIYGNEYDNEFQNSSNLPKYNFGFQAYASWKNFDFSMNWTGAAGYKIYWCETGKNAPTTTLGYAIPKSLSNDRYFYDPENPGDPRTNLTSRTPRIKHTAGGGQNTQASNLWLEKGDYLKLRNITLGYSLPAHLSSKLYAQNVRFFVSGENLLILTGFSGMDPEMRTAFGYVTMKQYAFGVNVTF